MLEYFQSLGIQEDQTYWLGLAAMTVTDMLSGLVICRVMDQRIRIFKAGL